jgi:hypothetical protein
MLTYPEIVHAIAGVMTLAARKAALGADYRPFTVDVSPTTGAWTVATVDTPATFGYWRMEVPVTPEMPYQTYARHLSRYLGSAPLFPPPQKGEA